MEMNPHVIAWVVGAVAAATVYGASHLRFVRRVHELQQRMEKIERARSVAEQQAAQARKQIEQLHKELAAQHRARAEEIAAQRRTPTIEQTRERLERELAQPSTGQCSGCDLPRNAFADTMPM